MEWDPYLLYKNASCYYSDAEKYATEIQNSTLYENLKASQTRRSAPSVSGDDYDPQLQGGEPSNLSRDPIPRRVLPQQSRICIIFSL